MATEVTSEPKKEKRTPHNPGLDVAGELLEYIEGSLFLINRHKRFGIFPPPLGRLMHATILKERIQEFTEWSGSIPAQRFEQPWLKFVGGLVMPPGRHNGNIHLYLVDDGLLSKSIPVVGINPGQLPYKERSRFFINQVFGLDISGQRHKSKIHLHAFDIADLNSIQIPPEFKNESVNMAKIRFAVADDHGPSGQWMKNPNYRMMAFCHKTRYPEGVPLDKYHPNLVANFNTLFNTQMRVWQRP